MAYGYDGRPTNPVYDREASGLTYDEWLYEQDADRAFQLEGEAEKQQSAALDTLWLAYRKAFDAAILGGVEWDNFTPELSTAMKAHRDSPTPETEAALAAVDKARHEVYDLWIAAKRRRDAAHDAYIAELERQG